MLFVCYTLWMVSGMAGTRWSGNMVMLNWQGIIRGREGESRGQPFSEGRMNSCVPCMGRIPFYREIAVEVNFGATCGLIPLLGQLGISCPKSYILWSPDMGISFLRQSVKISYLNVSEILDILVNTPLRLVRGVPPWGGESRNLDDPMTKTKSQSSHDPLSLRLIK